jgi:hypothetical protein
MSTSWLQPGCTTAQPCGFSGAYLHVMQKVGAQKRGRRSGEGVENVRSSARVFGLFSNRLVLNRTSGCR